MFVSNPSFAITPARTYQPPQANGVFSRGAGAPFQERQTERTDHGAGRPPSAATIPADGAGYRVNISPPDMVKRRTAAGQVLSVEIVQLPCCDRIEHRFCAPLHLLIVCEEGARQDGETALADLPRSNLRNLTQKLTFVPAGNSYHEWHQRRTPMRLTYFYFEPAVLQALADADLADMQLRPRLLFEDKALWDTALKLKRIVESAAPEDRLYFDALGTVLAHELIRVDRVTHHREPQIRGGLAAWQQRIVTAYIEEHLTEPIPLLTLAQLAKLSPHYFCRAFKQSLGTPPHRYHSIRRIERAKLMLANPANSVTEIGLRLGFSETSSFSTAFRKATGLTPTAYHRTLA